MSAVENFIARGAVARCAVAVVCSLWFALLAGYAGTWWWPLDLFAHFRVQYAALFLLCCAVLLRKRLWHAGAAAAIGLVICVVTVTAQTGGYARAVAASAERFRLVTFNAHFRNDAWPQIAEYLREIDPDAVILLELREEQVREIAGQLPSHPHVYARSSQPHYAAAVLSRWPILAAEGVELVSGGSRAVRARVALRDRTITLVGAHLHWPLGDRNASLRNMELASLARLARSETGPLLMGGDFNITPWSGHFRRMLGDSGLSDCARGRGWLPTWPAFFPPLGIRIDHCLASPHWRVLDVRTGPSLGSDHYATVNDLELMPAT